MLKHVLSAEQFFDRRLLKEIFDTASKLQKNDALIYDESALEGHQVVSLFYEPSTRTRFSFELAVQKLGGKVVSTENAKEFSSTVKGESIEDTVRVLSEYQPLAIVMRHDSASAAQTAARTLDEYGSKTRIINAGDGTREHPTQALLDVYTIQRELGGIDGRTVALCGDLMRGRTVHSLSKLLTVFDCKLRFVSPKELSLPEEYKEFLRERKVEFSEHEEMDAVVGADIIYMTRVQKERGSISAGARGLVIDADYMRRFNESGRIMHPLPRNEEIAAEVDKDPRAAYFRQAGNGLYLRMALLKMLAPNGLLR